MFGLVFFQFHFFFSLFLAFLLLPLFAFFLFAFFTFALLISSSGAILVSFFILFIFLVAAGLAAPLV